MADTEYRAFPSKEQIAAHGNGGLWERTNSNGDKWRLFIHNNEVWWDCEPWTPREDGRCAKAESFTQPEYSHVKWRPMRADWTPRPWEELGETPEAVEYRARPDAETLVRGKWWEAIYDSEIQRFYFEMRDGEAMYDCTSFHQPIRGRYSLEAEATDPCNWVGDSEVKWRPTDEHGKPVPWATVEQRFKVGDRVICQRFEDEAIGWNRRMDEHVGKVGMIQSVTEEGYFRMFGWLWPASALQLAPAEAPKAADATKPAERSLTVGDRVQAPSRQGQTGVIERDDKTEVPYFVRFDDGVEMWMQAENVSAASAETPTVAPKPAEVDFRPLTREIIEANPGQLWERKGYLGAKQAYILRISDVGIEWNQPSYGTPHWHPWIGRFDELFRPLRADGKTPMPWHELTGEAKGVPTTHGIITDFTIGLPGAQPDISQPKETKDMPTIIQTAPKKSRNRRAIDAALFRSPVEWTIDQAHEFVVYMLDRDLMDLPKEQREIIQGWAIRKLKSPYGKAMLGILAGNIAPIAASYLAKAEGVIEEASDKMLEYAYTTAFKEIGTDVVKFIGKPGLRKLKALYTGMTKGVERAEKVRARQIEAPPLDPLAGLKDEPITSQRRG